MQFVSGGSSNSVTPSDEYLVDPHSFAKSYSVMITRFLFQPCT